MVSKVTRAWAALLLGMGPAAEVAAGPPPQPFPEAAGRILGAAQVESRAYARLAHLTDRIGPRLSGSPGAAAAQRWAAGVMREDGLANVRLEKVMVPVWVRGVERAQVVAPAAHPLAITALGGSVPTPGGGLEAEVVEVDSLERLDQMGAAVSGKLVLFNRDMGRGPDDGYGAVSRLRVRGPSAAARHGAAGVLVRSLGTAAFRLPHTGALDYHEDAPRIPAAAVSEEDADLLHRLLASGDSVRVRLELGCRLEPDVEEANVVGEITGRERPAEVVLIGAHLDSWDLGTGALDDGFGVVVVLEAMRLLRALELQPRRTVRAVLFANEENGLRGGRGYAEAHAAELHRHVAAIESDSGGAALAGWGITAGEGAAEMLSALAAPLRFMGGAVVAEGGGGADIGPMKPAGVPQIALRQDASRYFDYHHTAADTLDKVRPEDLVANAAALAVVAYSLAEWEGTLPRLPAGEEAGD